MTNRDSSALPQTFYMNPFDPGIPKATDTINFGTTLVTLLGPVPQGRVYRVFDIDLYNKSVGTLTMQCQFIKDAGSGTVLPFASVSTLLGTGYRAPYLAKGVRFFETPIITMEFDDMLKVKTLTVPVTLNPTAVASYWDLPV